jgi:sensor histidine kinase regulating citrate/malate metabolism
LITALRRVTVTASFVWGAVTALYIVSVTASWATEVERSLIVISALSAMAAGLCACLNLVVKRIDSARVDLEARLAKATQEQRDHVKRLIDEAVAALRQEHAATVQAITEYGDERETVGYARGLRSISDSAAVNGSVLRFQNNRG